ncbi:hypothetical protein GW17_00050723 [Ensete ventricosum]|nr:hypothetical protein GW17_00050723 [Ensete ventricosum]RZS21099.1 hypothetical protein BHM03_00053682 [Ensete ventricosum]
MHRVDAVGNSLGVRRELAEDIGSLPGWCKRVCQKKIETREKIVEGSQKACRERLEDSSQECQRLRDWQELGLDYLDWSLSKPPVSDGQVYCCRLGFRVADDD